MENWWILLLGKKMRKEKIQLCEICEKEEISPYKIFKLCLENLQMCLISLPEFSRRDAVDA